jgi:hypothetical protein
MSKKKYRRVGPLRFNPPINETNRKRIVRFLEDDRELEKILKRPDVSPDTKGMLKDLKRLQKTLKYLNKR